MSNAHHFEALPRLTVTCFYRELCTEDIAQFSTVTVPATRHLYMMYGNHGYSTQEKHNCISEQGF